MDSLPVLKPLVLSWARRSWWIAALVLGAASPTLVADSRNGAEPGPPIVGKNHLIEGLDLILLPIEPGSAELGGASDADESHSRRHEAALTHPFWMGKYEVTQRQYVSLVGHNPSYFRGPDHPVERVSWHDATAFCRELSRRERAKGRLPERYVYRLPTESEWEYCCRAGVTSPYHFDVAAAADELGQYAWHRVPGMRLRTHPVGTKKPNGWGLHDMHGNVYEWCLDWYGPYPQTKAINPTGPRAGWKRVLRGGSWMSTPNECGCDYRMACYPKARSPKWGFRIVLAPRVVQEDGDAAERPGDERCSQETEE